MESRERPEMGDSRRLVQQVMINCRFMTTEGPYRTEAEERFGSHGEALDAVRARYGPRGFTQFRTVDGEEPDNVRVTARTPGGRPGRNVAYLDYVGDSEDGQA